MLRARAAVALRLQLCSAPRSLPNAPAPFPRSASNCRRFSASNKPSDAPYEALKRDFGRWMRGELLLLGAMLGIGVGGIYFYQVTNFFHPLTGFWSFAKRDWYKLFMDFQNREGAPWKQVTRLVKEAEHAADQVSTSFSSAATTLSHLGRTMFFKTKLLFGMVGRPGAGAQALAARVRRGEEHQSSR